MDCQIILPSLALIGLILSTLKTIIGEGRLINFLANRSKLSSFILRKGVVDHWFEKIGVSLTIIGSLGTFLTYIDW